MKVKSNLILASLFSLAAAPVMAADNYVAISAGLSNQSDVKNEGSLTADFTTGSVTGFPATTIGTDSDLEWDTDFDSGQVYSIAFGWQVEKDVRLELEYAYSESDVGSHDEDFVINNINLSAVDAGVLITGNTADLGVTTAAFIDNAGGKLKSSTILVNSYYDFNSFGTVKPFFGFGLGYSRVDVTYEPSNRDVLSDKDSTFVYQFILGVGFDITKELTVSAAAKYRDGGDITVSADATSGDLLSADLDLDVKSTIFDLTVRYDF